MTNVDTRGIRAAYVEQLQPKPAQWAEHRVRIQTVPAGHPITRAVPRRIGVFIGVSQFQDRRIRALRTPDQDARAMYECMRTACGLHEAFLLVNQQATLANVRQLICEDIRDKTSPGDTVIIYISTHGARCADDNGDEHDEFDELLVVYDSDITNVGTIRQTLLIDDQFGRWLQQLDGRRIAVILDTCHSGGQAKAEEDVEAKVPGAAYSGRYSKYLSLPGDRAEGDSDFLDDEFARVKDIGQRETVLLAAAEAAQTAFERREGDFSVMTHGLLQLLRADAGKISLPQAYQHVGREVPMYVEKRFPGTTQTPVLVDDTSSVLYLRP